MSSPALALDDSSGGKGLGVSASFAAGAGAWACLAAGAGAWAVGALVVAAGCAAGVGAGAAGAFIADGCTDLVSVAAIPGVENAISVTAASGNTQLVRMDVFICL